MKKHQLTEQEVLTMLDIPDFRHMTKDKIMKFTSSLPDMEPSVAIAALQQFPEFAKTSIDIMNCYKDMVGKVLEVNKESTKSFYESCDIVIDALKSLLDKDDLTFDQKSIVIDKMMAVLTMKKEKDSEEKKFHWAIIAGLGIVTTAIAGLLASSLGTNSEARSDDPTGEE